MLNPNPPIQSSWESNISPDSAMMPLIGCEINAAGGTFNTSTRNEYNTSKSA